MKKNSKQLKQRWIKGAIVEIDLMDGTYSYAQVLEDPQVAFFDLLRNKSQERPSINEILKSKLLFRLSVYEEAVRNEWLRIGREKYDPTWDISPSSYFIDSSTGEITIWKSEGGRVKGTEKDIEGMEYFSVWQSGAVEQRLRDHFAGRPCWYLEQDKPGAKPIGMKEFYAKYGYDFHWLDDDKSES